MHYKSFLFFLGLFFSSQLPAQSPGAGRQPAQNPATESNLLVKPIRIVDTMTAGEKTARNPVILRAELDSLIGEYNASQTQAVKKEPVRESNKNMYQYILAGLIVIMVLLGFVIYLFFTHRQKITRAMNRPGEIGKQGSIPGASPAPMVGNEKNHKGKYISTAPEAKISELQAELHKLTRENEGLNRVIHEYNGLQHEYDSLRHGIRKTYKVKNYPGYDKTKDELLALQGVFQTENMVASYAYEKFMKPILAITDNHKNSPAKLSGTDRAKLLDLLVSLSLFYIEYLYLRVGDLSIGGRMVERIEGLGKGNGPDISSLKKLNTEFGSRALVIKIALSKAELFHLSYPVFDETNLNNQ